MRIAVFHNLPSGGAKRTLQEQTRRLVGHHTVDIYSLTIANHAFADLRPYANLHKIYPFQHLPLLNSPFGRLNQVIRGLDLLRLERVYARMAEEIDRGGYDVSLVHPCQVEQAPGVINYMKASPVVYYCHESHRLLYETMPQRPYNQAGLTRRQILNRVDPLPGIYRSMLGYFDRRNTRAAGRVLVNSNFTQSSVERIYDVRAQVSYHGVDVQLFRPLEVVRKPMVLSVGSLTPLKGFDFIIQSVALIPAEIRPELTIASNFQNPHERMYLEDLVNKLSVKTQFLTEIHDDHLVELYNTATVTAYAPLGEPFGLVPLESMACGTPVVAVGEGGVSESIVHGETGLLIEREPTQFARAITQFLEHPDLVTRFGKNGRDHVLKNWSWDRAISSLEEHLRAAAALN